MEGQGTPGTEPYHHICLNANGHLGFFDNNDPYWNSYPHRCHCDLPLLHTFTTGSDLFVVKQGEFCLKLKCEAITFPSWKRSRKKDANVADDNLQGGF